MTGLGRILLWIFALSVSVMGTAQLLLGDQEPVAAFLPAQTGTVSSTIGGALPERVPGTALRIQALIQYEGPYWEDGTGEYVSNVAALVLHNTSGIGITSGQVSLELAGQEYMFEFTYLPAGGRLLIPEKNRLPYVREGITACRCIQLEEGNFGVENKGILLTPNGMSRIILENQTDQNMENVLLRYKLYLSDEDMFIGGTTYHTTAESLLAGEKKEITPPHFVWNYSAVIDIQTGAS